MMTPEMLDDALAAFAAEIKAGSDPTAAVKIAISAALEHVSTADLESALDRERTARTGDAMCIRRCMFGAKPSSENIQSLISYLARWNTSFSTGRIARATGQSTATISQEIERWMDANPGRLSFDQSAKQYFTRKAARRAKFKQIIVLQKGGA